MIPGKHWRKTAARTAKALGALSFMKLIGPPAGRVAALSATAGLAALVAALAGRARRYDLRGRVVLVTGGSRGLGLVLARAFVRAGAQVALCARDGDELSRAYEDLVTQGHEVLAIPAELGREGEGRRVVAAVLRRFGALDVIVNNAGVMHVGPMEDMTHADYLEAMAVHLWGPLEIVESALPAFRKQGGGRVVDISSLAGRMSLPHLLPYSVSKHALTALSRGLRMELGRHRVQVLTVFPGLMRTGSVLNAVFKGRADQEYAWMARASSVPFLSIGERRAARQILRALKGGKGEVVLGMGASMALALHDRAPELTYDLLGLVARRLPTPGGIGTASALGRMSRETGDGGWIQRRTEKAGRRTNQLAPAAG